MNWCPGLPLPRAAAFFSFLQLYLTSLERFVSSKFVNLIAGRCETRGNSSMRLSKAKPKTVWKDGGRAACESLTLWEQGKCHGDGALVVSCFPKAAGIFGLPLLSIKNQMAQLNLKGMIREEQGGSRGRREPERGEGLCKVTSRAI